MTKKPMLSKRRFAFWLAGMMSVALCGGYARAGSNRTVTDERPVAKAIEELERQYRVPITYEDTLYFSGDEVADVTESVRLDHGYGSDATRVLVPVRRTIGFALPESGSESETARSEAALEAVRGVLDSYALAAGTRAFTVSQDGSGLHVVGRIFRDAAGHEQKMRPFLDKMISMSGQGRPALEVLQEMCRKVSAQGGKVLNLGTAPTNLLAHHQVNLNEKNVRARNVLESVSKQMGVRLSWQLFCDPADGGCALNLHVVE
jgi:hypothetical protein